MLVTFFKEVLLLSVASSFTIILIFFIRVMMKNRLPHRLALLLWIPVMLQLVNPFVPEIQIVKLMTENNHMADIVGSVFQKDITENDIDPINRLEGQNVQNGVSSHHPDTNTGKSFGASGADVIKPDTLWYMGIEMLSRIWLAGVLFFIVRVLSGYLFFIGSVKRHRFEITDPQMNLMLYKISNKLGIRKQVRLYFFDKVHTPMLIGIFRPMILLPVENYSSDELSFVLAHELSHYKSHDLVYKWAGEIIRCIHWFNPLVYFAVNSIGRDCELCCDERVVRITGDHTAYGNTLIRIAGKINRLVLPANAMLEGRKHMRKRITNLAHIHHLPSFRRGLASIYLILLAGMIVFGTSACKSITGINSTVALASGQDTAKGINSGDSLQQSTLTVDNRSANEKDNAEVKDIQTKKDRQAYYDRYFGPIDVPTSILNKSWDNLEQVDAQDIFMFFIANSGVNKGLSLMDEKQEESYFHKQDDTYKFPASVYEPIVRKYFDVSPEHLKTAQSYNKITKTYDIKFLTGFGGGRDYEVKEVHVAGPTVTITVVYYDAQNKPSRSVTLVVQDNGDTFRYLSCTVAQSNIK